MRVYVIIASEPYFSQDPASFDPKLVWRTVVAVCNTLPMAQRTIAELESIKGKNPDASYSIEQWPVAGTLDNALLQRHQPMPNKAKEREAQDDA